MNKIHKDIALPVLCMLVVGCVSTPEQDRVVAQNLSAQCEAKVNVVIKPTQFGILGYTTATTLMECTEMEKVNEFTLTTEE